MRPDDQPRPDLDTAVDAVVAALTAVSDDTVAASLRRALAARSDARRASAWGWGLAATATAGVIVLVSLVPWQPQAPAPTAIVERRPATPAVVTTPSAQPAPQIAPVPVAPERVASGEPAAPRRDRRRTPPVHATSTPAVAAVAPRPDPLVALVRAVRDIPEEAWNESLSRADSPVSVPDVAINPILVPELVTPPIADPSADANAPGDF